MSRKQTKTSNPTLKIVTSALVLGGALYGAYQYIKSSTIDQITSGSVVQNIDDSSNKDLRKKKNKDTSISFVITKSILKDISDYNDSHEDGIDLQNYLKYYENLNLILYPGLDKKNLEVFFEIDDSYNYRILLTEKEESIFHILKQLRASLNLICFKDFISSKESIEEDFHIDKFLNMVSLDDQSFTNII